MNEKYITISAEILESSHLRVRQVADKLGVGWDRAIDMILAHASAKLLNEIDEITSTEWLKKAIASDSIKSNSPEATKDSNLNANLADLSQKIDEVLSTLTSEIEEKANYTAYDINLLREDTQSSLSTIHSLLNRLVSATEALATVNSELAAKGVK